MKVKNILVTQQKPETEKNPYAELAKKFNVKIEFKPFIHVEPIHAQAFRKERINLSEYSAVILTSKQAADHFFRMCNEMRFAAYEDLKYFCVSESTAFYLQKYIVYRKRKIFYGRFTINDLMDVIKKHRKEKFLVPCSNVHKQDITIALDAAEIDYKKAVIYKTVLSNLNGTPIENYDMIVFFSPSGIKSLFKNFPKFKQSQTRIAAFGATTAEAVLKSKLKLDVQAPVPTAPSMTMAIEQYLKKANR